MKRLDTVCVGKIAGYVLKASILLLFFCAFVGFFNPARISKSIAEDASLIKSVFYFRSFVSGVIDDVTSEKQAEDTSKNALASDDGELEDYYAKLAEMMTASPVSTSDDGANATSANALDGSEGFSARWKSFCAQYADLANVFNFARILCVLSFVAIMICVLGMYLTCAVGAVRKIGYIVVCVGGALVCASMIAYSSLHAQFAPLAQKYALTAINMHGTIVFVVFALLSALASAYLSVNDKKLRAVNALQTKQDEVALVEKFNVRPFQVTFRVVSLLLFVFLFLPTVNPARIMDHISRNVSLFTSGFAYGTYVKNIERVIIRGLLPQSVVTLAYVSSLIACLGVIACGLGSCASVGNNKLKRIGHIALLAGSAACFVSMFGILTAHNLVSTSPNVARLNPVEPSGYEYFMVLSVVIFITAAVSFAKTPAPAKDEKCHIEAPLQLFLMLLPFLILVFIFSYLPLWGWRYAFFDYSAGDVLSMENWVGLKWFKAPFENAATRSDIVRVLKNTLAMSALGLLTSWCPMFFAIFLSEIKNSGIRRVIQTLTTIPNFISWVLVYAIAFCIFGTEGFISSLMVNNGIWSSGRNMLMGESFIWIKMLLWGMWKGLGWSAIMYIAAISGIDQELYEAATVDGANRFQKMFKITLPELIPTFVVLLILAVSNILSNGMDQYLVFKNSTNKGPIEVLDLYVYQLTFGSGNSSNIPFSTVVSMFKSFVSVILLFLTNRISKWVRGTSIF